MSKNKLNFITIIVITLLLLTSVSFATYQEVTPISGEILPEQTGITPTSDTSSEGTIHHRRFKHL